MMSHDAFVYLSYGSAFLVLGGLVIWLLLDRAATKRDLKKLEEAGARRRSDGGPL